MRYAMALKFIQISRGGMALMFIQLTGGNLTFSKKIYFTTFHGFEFDINLISTCILLAWETVKP